MQNLVDEPSEPDDEQMCELLDRFVGALQSGDEPLRQSLARAYPQITRFAEYLQALDSLGLSVNEQAAQGNAITDVKPAAGPLEMHAPPRSSVDRLAETVAVPDSNGLQLAAETSSDQTFTVRNEFGKYELLEETGRGGMGVVYKARQIDLNRIVAVKMILASRLASADDVRRFQREARAAGSLRHPHIVGIHEVGQLHGQHYFTMDFVDGENLAGLLRRGLPDIDFAVRLLVCVARAVDYLHAYNIIHRDLKPSNILLDKRGQPFVTDFGLAKVFQNEDDRTETGTILGTPSYMSPEQAAGRTSEMTRQSDVYSLGAILYEMLTGRPVFRDDNPFNIRLQVLESEPTLPTKLNPRIPHELERICMGCLEKNPADRYATAASLAEDLERFLRGEPVEVPATTWRQTLRRWTRRQPALVSHLAVLFAVMAIVQIKFMINGYDLPFHLRIMAVLGVWGCASLGFQWLLNRPRTAVAARYAWAGADLAFLTTGLYLADEPLGPLLISYPLVLVAAGLWFSERLVATTTLVALVSYSALVTMRPESFGQSHYRLIFGAILVAIGGIVAYQVRRLRALSRYFEQQRL